ncbi:MAG: glycoside hydrolase family protein [Advenella sp.]|uniref:lysozyme n=1 Tax=Advenella sp. TaxID=1872388 RepID=UPI002583A3EB|nr:glycoside hydrolase family protein [Advenella sp.]MDD3757719.1 glycoside hydrolase family protein [Advenella sp.]
MNKKGIAALISSGAIVLASPFLMDFLGKWEGRGQNIVYADKLAGGLPTVCKGITKWTSPYPVIVGERWSDKKCEEVEKQVTIETQIKLAQCVTNKNIGQNVFDALTSHAHNVGVNNTCSSRAVRLINAGQIAAGCDALAHGPNGSPAWSYADGKFVRGLYNRRLDERKLCLKDT